MQVTVDIPDTLAAQLTAAGKDPARIALDALTLEGLRERDLAADADFHEAVRQGREDIAAGRTYPAEEVFAELRAQYGIPD
jgi:predicted transcriptional regulator